jgi:hypothetical protein
MDENDIKEIVQKFEATVPPGDEEAARVFFEEVFPNFSQDLKDAFLREALVSAIEQSAEELMAGRKGDSEA